MEHTFFNFQGNAGFGVLAFLGTSLLLGISALTFILLRIKRRRRLANKILIFMIAVSGLYLGTLLIYSLTSREQVLDLNEEKYFCEVDCHLAYSVIDVTGVKTLGDPQRESDGIYYIVTIRVRFDENTISPTRGNQPLSPNSRTVVILDSDGHRYQPSADGYRALESVQGGQIPLTQSLRPGESYTTSIAFDLPSDIGEPQLLITEADQITYFLIGHENSFFHKKTRFQLGT